MKTHKLSIIGYIIGAVIIGCSTIQWFFRFPYPSQLIFGLFVGIIVYRKCLNHVHTHPVSLIPTMLPPLQGHSDIIAVQVYS